MVRDWADGSHDAASPSRLGSQLSNRLAYTNYAKPQIPFFPRPSTRKVSLGMQLPHDQTSSCGRTRAATAAAAAATVEKAFAFSCRSKLTASYSAGRSRRNGNTGRRRMRAMPRSIGGTGCSSSWSPPSTKTSTFSGLSSTAGSNSSTLDRESRGEGRRSRGSATWESSYLDADVGQYNHGWRSSSGSDGGGGSDRPRSRLSPSPLMVPLDSYRDSRMVVRAGTLVSRGDVATLEQSSRRTLRAMRRVSEAREKVEREYADDNGLGFSPGYLTHNRRQQTRACGYGSRHRNAWVTGRSEEGFRSGRQDTEEAARGRARRMFPSVELMDRELEAIRRADSAMRDEELAQVGHSRLREKRGHCCGVCITCLQRNVCVCVCVCVLYRNRQAIREGGPKNNYRKKKGGLIKV